MKRLSLCLVACCLAGRTALAAPDVDALVARCDSPDPNIAVAACSRILAAGPDMEAQRFTALTRRAAAALALNQPASTIADDTAALAINPQSGLAFETRGRAYDQQSNFAAAMEDERRAVQLLPHDPEPLYFLGAFAFDAGLYGTSKDAETRVIALSPGDVAAYVQRAWDEQMLGESAADLADLQAAVRVAPDDPDAYAALGMFDMKHQRDQEAIAMFDRALALDPDEPMANAYRGLYFEMQGKSREAIAHLSVFIDDPAMHDDDLMVRCRDMRGFAYDQIGAPDQAIADFTAAIALDPRDVFAYGGRADLYRRQGDYAQARRDDDSAISLSPRAGFAYAGLALIEAAQKHFAAAARDEAAVVALDPGDAGAWTRLCRDHAAAGDLDAGLGACRQAVRLAPRDEQAWDSFGYLGLRRHDEALALRSYSTALSIDPDSASALYGRALAEQALGDKGQAAADRAAALKRAPDIGATFGS